ncbi:DUF3006 domain-containing protein [Alteribacter natronophilus]|uniref:DUF3006 domain-containing protein n=1 Tax=Alteribacter natronophilus TaxID=2583810 RepID=UPI0014863CD7|nr:DUF3006 domain-containing protein [Alteribacter natronophilus]
MGKKQAVLDRIEDGQWAVLLAGKEEEEIILPVSKMPGGASEGDWFTLTFVGDTVSSVVSDNEAGIQAKENISRKMEALKKKKGSRFKTKRREQ